MCFSGMQLIEDNTRACTAISRGYSKKRKLELEIRSLRQSVYQAYLFRVSSEEKKKKKVPL